MASLRVFLPEATHHFWVMEPALVSLPSEYPQLPTQPAAMQPRWLHGSRNWVVSTCKLRYARLSLSRRRARRGSDLIRGSRRLLLSKSTSGPGHHGGNSATLTSTSATNLCRIIISSSASLPQCQRPSIFSGGCRLTASSPTNIAQSSCPLLTHWLAMYKAD